jgi:hypothetical protein
MAPVAELDALDQELLFGVEEPSLERTLLDALAHPESAPCPVCGGALVAVPGGADCSACGCELRREPRGAWVG